MAKQINLKHRQKIKQLYETGLPLDAIIAAYGYDSEQVLAEMRQGLLKCRLEKLSQLSQVIEDMALAQKSVTLTMAWFKQQLEGFEVLNHSGSEKSPIPNDIDKFNVTEMADEALKDEIHRLLQL